MNSKKWSQNIILFLWNSKESIYILWDSLFLALAIGRFLHLWFDHVKGTYQVIVYIENCSPIFKHSAIIRGWEYGHQLFLPKKLISLFNNLHRKRQLPDENGILSQDHYSSEIASRHHYQKDSLFLSICFHASLLNLRLDQTIRDHKAYLD